MEEERAIRGAMQIGKKVGCALAFGVGKEVWGMATPGLEVLKPMEEHTTA